MITRYASSPVSPHRRKKRGVLRRFFNVRLLVIVVIVLGAFWLIQNLPTRSDSPTTSTKSTPVKTKTTTLSKGTPTYTTYLPAGKKIDEYLRRQIQSMPIAT
jgi:hypothetical protein